MFDELVVPSPLADDLVKAAVASYNALASVLDLLQRCKTHRDVAPHALQDSIQRHQQLRLGVYTDERHQPKMHFASHLPYALREHELLCCWVHERKHREIKRYAENQANAGDSTAYETNQLQRTFLAQFYSLETLYVEKSTQLVNCEPICVKQCCRNTCANLFGMQSVATSPSDGITKCYRQCFYSCFFQGCRSDPFRCWRSLVSRGHW